MSENSQLTEKNEAPVDAISDLHSALLTGMEALNYIGRNLHPPNLGDLISGIEDLDAPLHQGLKHFRSQKWPDHMACFSGQLITAAEAVCSGFDYLRAATSAPDGIFMAYRGIRQNAKAFAAI